MKFTDGYWALRPQYAALYAMEIDDIRIEGDSLTVYAPTHHIQQRGDVLNRPMLTIRFSAPVEGVIRTHISHFAGGKSKSPSIKLNSSGSFKPELKLTDKYGIIRSGNLEARIPRSGPWQIDYLENGRLITQSVPKSVAAITSSYGNGNGQWIHEQLTIDPGESLYGLGERFGPFVKNGQVVDIWNEDGGTASQQAYKNIPFYISSKGYGVLVDTPDRVSYEVGSEVNTRVQFSVEGQSLEYLVIAGPQMKDVLSRYTSLTGRAPQVPDWSYGLWLSTSFTTDYDEDTVMSFVDGMIERDIPLSVFHFDCFWMREYQWVDFEWDPRTFKDPEGLLQRLHDKGLKVCVWINPYIAQRSSLFAEGMANDYLVKTTSGDVWQWDKWQAGMGLVDFTNPAAVKWYTDKLRKLIKQGVDCFKTDFGERIPVGNIAWFDGSDPARMHNYYTHLYNKAVFDLLKEEKGEGQAVLFARSATVGGQQFPVHWGGDCDSTFSSMAESLRGGLSLGLSGFGYWSHDIGGFEGTPDATVFKRWVPFGLLSSHSRFHGSGSYRVPWAFDEEAVSVTRNFSKLKMRLMPYLSRIATETTSLGLPMMRPMVLEFPEDRSTHPLDMQYMLGDSLCVSPVFNEVGTGETYLPTGTWTHLLSGNRVTGSQWIVEDYGFDSLGLFLRPGTVLPLGARDDRPEYAWAEDVTLILHELPDGFDQAITIPGGTGTAATFHVIRSNGTITASSEDAPSGWKIRLGLNGQEIDAWGATSVSIEVR